MQRRPLDKKFIKALAKQRGCDSLLKLFDKEMVQTELSVYLLTPFEILSEIKEDDLVNFAPAFSFDPSRVAGRDD